MYGSGLAAGLFSQKKWSRTAESILNFNCVQETSMPEQMQLTPGFACELFKRQGARCLRHYFQNVWVWARRRALQPKNWSRTAESILNFNCVSETPMPKQIQLTPSYACAVFKVIALVQYRWFINCLLAALRYRRR